MENDNIDMDSITVNLQHCLTVSPNENPANTVTSMYNKMIYLIQEVHSLEKDNMMIRKPDQMGRRDIGITKSPILLIRSYRLFEYDES
jgi:hypothetical protein